MYIHNKHTHDCKKLYKKKTLIAYKKIKIFYSKKTNQLKS